MNGVATLFATLAALAAGGAAWLCSLSPRRFPATRQGRRPAALAAARLAGLHGRRAERLRRERMGAELPVAADLLATALRSGMPFAEALGMVAQALEGPLSRELASAAERLRLGADPAQLWQGADAPAPLAEVGRAVTRAERSGAPVAELFERLSDDARGEAHARDHARAQRTQVLVVLPLGLCFLPAFVLIGVVPLAAGLISAFLGG